jgi:glycosyltransferase involved in cell wall biosynthesis
MLSIQNIQTAGELKLLNSHNEWDTLKEVIVGSATNAHWPKDCAAFRNLEKTTSWKETPVPSGPIDKKIIEYDLSSVIYYSHPVYDSFSKNLKFKNSDIIILPSKNENFAFSVCEAMFASRIVLCSNQTPWEEVNKAEIGYCLDLNSKENIILALKKIFNCNKNKLREMGKKANDYILPKYDLENVVIYKYIEFYKSLI